MQDVKAEHKVRACLNGDSQHWHKIRKGAYGHMAYASVRCAWLGFPWHKTRKGTYGHMPYALIRCAWLGLAGLGFALPAVYRQEVGLVCCAPHRLLWMVMASGS